MHTRPDTILIFDFGGQYCHLIGRRIRDNNVYSEIVPHDMSLKKIKDLKERLNIKGIILSGGPSSVYKKGSPKMNKEIFELSIPILGICYGHQLIAYSMAGKVEPARKKEYGISFATIKKAVNLLKGLKKKEKVWMSHGDTVFSLPSDFEIMAYSTSCPVAAFRHKQKPIYAVQWHPEVSHTENGRTILRNFIFDICQSEPNWNVGNLIKKYITEIKETVANNKVIIALSGGIDSSTATVLASKALGKNLTAVFVDNGLIRENEAEQIRKTFNKFNINFISVNARDKFLKKLKGVIDPEEKRKIIGKEFIRVFEDVAKKIKANYLLQGTIYPDRIESGYSKKSDKIKTHHNVAGLPTKIKFKGIVEPLENLYKDEVRKLARQLGLPNEIVYRQPFPGPGLAVRIIGEITEEKLKLLRKADKIVTEEIEKSGLGNNLWQYFAILTDTKTTGVKGDARSYGYTVAIRIIESREAMTANFAKIPYDILGNISTRITNEIPQVVRVVYDITNKPPSTIEWE